MSVNDRDNCKEEKQIADGERTPSGGKQRCQRDRDKRRCQRDCGKRLIAATMALVVTAAVPQMSFAGAPKATVDEAMYINADYYGGLQDVTVVKGCNTNGLTEFVDYGDYKVVSNMSDRTEPVINGDAVKWTVPEDTKRFYFSATPKEQVQLPWLFDVSYSLNGEPSDPSQLAGAAGLVEIKVKATPNEKASDYYQKNMLLQVVVMADMEKTNSIRAQGAQLQSIGKMTVALFLGLPGEENTYTVQIGTDSFESSGVIMTMIPASASQLDQIKDLKKAIDKSEDAGDALYDGLNAMLDAVSGMKPGLQQVKSGVSDLNEARKIADGKLDDVLDSVDGAIVSLKETSATLKEMDRGLDDLSGSLMTLRSRLRSTKSQVADLTDEIDDLDDDVEALLKVYMENYVTEQVENNKTLMGEISSQVKDQVTKELTELGTKMAIQAVGGMEEFGKLTPEEQAALVSECVASIDGDTKDKIQEEATNKAKKNVLTEERLRKEIPYYKEVKNLQSSLKNTISELKGMGDEMEDLLSATSGVMNNTSGMVQDLRKTLDKTADLLTSLGDLMGKTQEVLRESRPYVQSGSANSFEGMMATLDQTVKALDSTRKVKNANTVLKNTIDDEVDSLRNDNKLLEVDPEAPLQSCTSLRNPSPNTLQIIVRTHEVSIDEQQKAVVDLESEKEPGTPFTRMIAIFKEIIHAIAQVFAVKD